MRISQARPRNAYRNPVALALQWRKALDKGEYSSQADLAREKGFSHARVTQILNLLRLAPKVIGMVMGRSDPQHSALVTERQLRGLINPPAQNLLREITIILGAIESSEKTTRRS